MCCCWGLGLERLDISALLFCKAVPTDTTVTGHCALIWGKRNGCKFRFVFIQTGIRNWNGQRLWRHFGQAASLSSWGGCFLYLVWASFVSIYAHHKLMAPLCMAFLQLLCNFPTGTKGQLLVCLPWRYLTHRQRKACFLSLSLLAKSPAIMSLMFVSSGKNWKTENLRRKR